MSLSNKLGGELNIYLSKRQVIVETGLVFVEIDYLHETPPTFDVLPHYPEPGLYPYRISVFEPRPDAYQGTARIRQFNVDEPIPRLTIPVSDADTLAFDFNAPYQRTFEEMLYGLELVDYHELPINFERYSPDDQARIVNWMIAVLDALENGADLETSAFEVEPLVLETALEKLNMYKHDQ